MRIDTANVVRIVLTRVTWMTGDQVFLMTIRTGRPWVTWCKGRCLQWPTFCLFTGSQQSQPTEYQGPRGVWATRVLQPLHMGACLKEHWLIWLTLISSAYSLLSLATMDTSYIDCRCDCQQPAGYFEKCYQDSVCSDLSLTSL